jgi:nucleotide-binding universal stress UspA family protein
MIRRILVGLGGSPYSGPATRHAVELATAHGAEVTAVTLMSLDGFDRSGFYLTGAARETKEWGDEQDQITQDALEEAVSELERACEEADVPYHVHWESGDPLDRLVSAGRYHDLVICGLRALFDYGITAHPRDSLVRLIRRGTQPILAVAEEYHPVRRVLVAYSGSPESARALRAFVQLGAWPRCELSVAAFGRDGPTADKLLSDVAAYCEPHGYTPRLHHSQRSPVEAILETARGWPADLIVMGDGAHGVLARKVLGDTLLHVVRQADRPLFLTH